MVEPKLVIAAAALPLLLAGCVVEQRDFEALKEQVRVQQRQINDLKARQEELRNLRTAVAGSPTMLDVLAELTRVLPTTAHLTQLVARKGAIELSGFADGASGLIQTLEESPMFRNVAFDAPITAQGAQKERFKIRMALEP